MHACDSLPWQQHASLPGVLIEVQLEVHNGIRALDSHSFERWVIHSRGIDVTNSLRLYYFGEIDISLNFTKVYY